MSALPSPAAEGALAAHDRNGLPLRVGDSVTNRGSRPRGRVGVIERIARSDWWGPGVTALVLRDGRRIFSDSAELLPPPTPGASDD